MYTYIRVIYYTAESNAVIVLEDLTNKMYAVPDATMNLDKTLATVFKLARWHATSLYMAKEVSFVFTAKNDKTNLLIILYPEYRIEMCRHLPQVFLTKNTATI